MLIIYNLTQAGFSERKADSLHRKLFSRFDIQPRHILELVLVNRKLIKKLNQQYLDRDEETDVLSFPVDNSHIKNNRLNTIFGSIYLCPDYIQQQEKNSKNYDQYIIHGFIHLLGYDHYSKKDKQKWAEILEEIDKIL